VNRTLSLRGKLRARDLRRLVESDMALSPQHGGIRCGYLAGERGQGVNVKQIVRCGHQALSKGQDHLDLQGRWLQGSGYWVLGGTWCNKWVAGSIRDEHRALGKNPVEAVNRLWPPTVY
jgi:hypothetical protein